MLGQLQDCIFMWWERILRYTLLKLDDIHDEVYVVPATITNEV